jgi:adenylyltransferase/sulfurtransferase
MRPKAEAAASRLRAVNSNIVLDPAVAHLDIENIDELLDGVDLVVDGTDNVATRFLLNDWAFARGVPWLYVGAVGGEGMLLPIMPPQGPCLRCLLPEPPPPGVLATCDTAGVVGSVPAAMGAMAATEAIKLVVSGTTAAGQLRSIDFWHWRVHTIALPARRTCPTCVEHRFDFLEKSRGTRVIEICGRDSYQIVPSGRGSLDLQWIADQWGDSVSGKGGSFLSIKEKGIRLILFADGRAMVEGAGEIGRARAFYDRVVGG